jgi:hypothetical protein
MARKKIVVVEEPTSTCKQCRHSHFHKDYVDCRRYPPTVVYDIGEQSPVSYFPVVQVDLMCGEFAPKLDS